VLRVRAGSNCAGSTKKHGFGDEARVVGIDNISVLNRRIAMMKEVVDSGDEGHREIDEGVESCSRS
jgi:hypothetical protein